MRTFRVILVGMQVVSGFAHDYFVHALSQLYVLQAEKGHVICLLLVECILD